MVDRIKVLAKEKMISISTIEKSVGLSNGIIGKWKKQSPSCDKLKLVADYLNTSIDYLLTGEEKKSSEFKLSSTEQDLLNNYNKLSNINKERILEIMKALTEIEKDNDNK